MAMSVSEADDTNIDTVALPARLGAVIAEKYTLLRVLGKGGMGAVYEAEHNATGKRVAVKVLYTHHAANPTTSKRFLREARAATTLEHPNIIEVFDVGEDKNANVLYLVQRLLRGESLLSRLDGQAVGPREALSLVCPIMDALAFAHSKGLVHRDIKPENIFLARTADAKTIPTLIDFGIAKSLKNDFEGDSLHTSVGAPMGTPAFMSPEQARGDSTVDHRTDIWSLGVVLFECLSGRLPYNPASVGMMLTKILTTPAPPLLSVAPSVPLDVCALVDRALRHNLDERWQSMEQWASEARRVLAQLPEDSAQIAFIQAPVRESALNITSPNGLLPVQPAVQSAPESSPSKSRVWLRRGAGIALALSVVVGVFAVSRLVHTSRDSNPVANSQHELITTRPIAVASTQDAGLGLPLSRSLLAQHPTAPNTPLDRPSSDQTVQSSQSVTPSAMRRPTPPRQTTGAQHSNPHRTPTHAAPSQGVTDLPPIQ
jgi:serine/threonine-protein kinase